MGRKRGERNWEEAVSGDYELHLPTDSDLEHLKMSQHDIHRDTIFVHGHECILAADGQLERVIREN